MNSEDSDGDMADIEEIRLDGEPSAEPFDAVCLRCGTRARFTTSGERTMGERFEQQCVQCGTGIRPALGAVRTFCVVAVGAERSAPSNPPPVFDPADAPDSR